ncbi:hypothetical protein pb186bvf_012304 [Paramecium bursaria]
MKIDKFNLTLFMGCCYSKSYEQNETQDNLDKSSYSGITNIQETPQIQPMVDGQIKLFPEEKRIYFLSQTPSIDKQDPISFKSSQSQIKTVQQILQIMNENKEVNTNGHPHKTKRQKQKRVEMEDLERIF